MKTVGIIGNGFVGSAIAEGFKHYTDVKIYDKDESKSIDLIEHVLQQDIVFICVPTPMLINEGGKCDLSIIEDVFTQASKLQTQSLLVIKSTVEIGTTNKIQEKYPELNIVHSPEFLTARTAKLDFITPSRNIVGHSSKFTNLDGRPSFLVDLYEERFPGVACILMSSDESETVKYAANCFFAVKISYFNQIKLLCDKLDLNWDKIIEGTLSDGRIGVSHYQVPGHDGKPGFGGTCFPKDINSLIVKMNSVGVDAEILKSAWNLNLKVRPEKDWENFSSAVSKKDFFTKESGFDITGCGHDHT